MKQIEKLFLYLILLILFITPLPLNPSFSQTSYKAKIANYPITIELKKEDNNKIIGRYKYDKVGKWLKLEGKIPTSSNRVIINEYDENDKNTGYFIGILNHYKNQVKLIRWHDIKKSRSLKVTAPIINIGKGKEEIITKTFPIKFKRVIENFSELIISPSGEKVIVTFYTKDGERFQEYVQINDELYGPYDFIRCDFLKDNDYERCYFTGEDYKRYLKFDKKIYGPYRWVESFQSSDNGEIIGFVFEKLEKPYLFYVAIGKRNDELDDFEILGPFEEVKYESIKFSQNGLSFIFAYKKDGQFYIYANKNGEKYIKGPYLNVENLTLSKDGEKISFIYKNNLHEYYAEINGKEYGPFENASSLICDENFQKCIFRFTKNGKEFIWVNNSILGPFKDIGVLNLSKNGNSLAFPYKDSYGLSYIRINSKTYGPYDEAYNITLSNEGNSFGFIFSQYFMHYVNINGKIYGPYDYVKEINLSPDGRQFAFIFKKKNYYFLNFNNSVFGPYENVGGVSFSNNSLNFGCIFTYYGNTLFYINDQIYGPYLEYPSTFVFDKFNRLVISYIRPNINKKEYEIIVSLSY